MAEFLTFIDNNIKLTVSMICTSLFDDNSFFNRCAAFDVLNQAEKEFLYQNHSCSLFKKGDIIYNEGSSPSGLSCLSQGKVKIFRDGSNGKSQIVRLASPFGFIGYRALFAGEQYKASAIAIEDSEVCIIDKEVLFKILKSNSAFAIKMLEYMACELGISNRRTGVLTQKHIRGRLAESLLFLIDTYGYESDNKTIKVYLSREDIANLSNMTTSNAIRTLSCFASEGVISLVGKRICVNDAKELQKISELG